MRLLTARQKLLILIKGQKLILIFRKDVGPFEFHGLGQHAVGHREVFRDAEEPLRNFLAAEGLGNMVHYFIQQTIF